jgi:hypothetical protein
MGRPALVQVCERDDWLPAKVKSERRAYQRTNPSSALELSTRMSWLLASTVDD